VARFAFVDRERAFYPVSLLCDLLKVSRSGLCAWTQRGPSKRTIADEVLAEQIHGFYAASRRTYGAPRILDDLRDAGVHVGRKRVSRIMRANGWQGVDRRCWRHFTKADPAAVPAPDLLDRDFTATAPDQKWVADVTYVPTVMGWLHLAIVLEVFSRRIVGWSMDINRKTRLVCDAVAMAVATRGGHVAGVIHHSDRGGEYTSRDLEVELRRLWCARVDGIGRRLLRQLDGRGVLRHPGNRAVLGPAPPPVRHPPGRQAGDLRLHRGLLQSAAPAYLDRQHPACHVRSQIR
jgi:transposase InsO family protein